MENGVFDSPPPPFRPQMPLVKAFWELSWDDTGPKWVKIASNHLFQHPEWFRNKFGKNHFRPLFDLRMTPTNSALAHAQCTTL